MFSDTGTSQDFADLALVFNRKTGHGDLALDENGQLVMDYTPATPMILSTGCDRRANPDDVLPSGVEFFNAARGALGLRRGALADVFAANGKRTGCRIWLLDREKQDDPEPDTTRKRAIFYLQEGLLWAEEELGEAADITANWIRPGTLQWTARIGNVSVRGSLQGGA